MKPCTANRSTLIITVISLAVLGVGCGGEEVGGNSVADGDQVVLSDIPTLDASKYDFSTSEYAVEGLTKRSVRQLTGQSTFSRAACESHTLKREVFRDAQQIESFLCYIKTLEKHSPDLKIPNQELAYYEIRFPEKTEEHGPPTLVRVRIGRLDGQLRMDACTGSGDGSFSRESELRFTPSETGYTGFVVNSHQGEWEGELRTGGSRIDVIINGTSTEDFSDASFLSTRHDAGDSGYSWMSQAEFTADASTHTNSLGGASANISPEWGTNTNRMFGQWGLDLIGTVKYATTGEYAPPTEEQCLSWGMSVENLQWCVGKCWQDGQEVSPNANGKCEYQHSDLDSFQIGNTTEPPTFTKIEASASNYFEAVNGKGLPTLSDVEAATTFVDSWDCSAPSEFTPIDATALVDIAESCEPEWDNEMWRMCEEQQRAADGN